MAGPGTRLVQCFLGEVQPCTPSRPFEISSKLMKTPKAACLMVALAVTCFHTLHSQHAHINAGALSREQGSPLSFLNGGLFVTNSGYLVPLVHTNAGPYANLHQGSISFTGLPATGSNGGPAFGHALPGSDIRARVETLEGPEGGKFGFWEEEDAMPRFEISTGEREGTNSFALSEGDGSADADPYGHIHGRRFTANKAGLYVIGLRLVDVSNHGPLGASRHQPSELFHLFFQAGTSLGVPRRAGSTLLLDFGALPSIHYWLERAEDFPATFTWEMVEGPITGQGRIVTLIRTESGKTSFFRLRAEVP